MGAAFRFAGGVKQIAKPRMGESDVKTQRAPDRMSGARVPVMVMRRSRDPPQPYFLVAAFFLPATVRFGPFRVRALVFVRCPRTGRPRRCRSPR